PGLGRRRHHGAGVGLERETINRMGLDRMQPREEWKLPTKHLGRRILVFDELDSTNSLAAQLAHEPDNAGLVILADRQTAGRGQHGRTWQCPPRSGVLMSVLLFPPPGLRRPAVLTAWAAVCV